MVGLIRPLINPAHEIQKRAAHHFVAARSGVVTAEIPIAFVVRAGGVEVFDFLKNYF